MRDKTYSVKITPQAEIQLSEITKFLVNELNEPIIAKRLLARIEQSVLSLSTFPYRTKLLDREPWRSAGVRLMPISNFIIYLWIDEENCIVHVIAVVYGRRDQLKQLLQLDLE